MSAPREWGLIRAANTLAVHRGEEQIFYLDAKVEGRETAQALAKLLNERAELLRALKVCWHSMNRRDEPGSPAYDGSMAQAYAAIATAEGK